MHHLSVDIETFASIDIKKSGLYKYAQSPDFEILLFAYALDDAPVQIVDMAQGERVPTEVLSALQDPAVVKHAYNAAFEWFCLNRLWYTPLNQWRDTMLHELYCGYTAGLGATAVALGLPDDRRKMSVGLSLIKTFCTPTAPNRNNGQRTRTLPHHEPEKWNLFKDYCRQDVVTEMEIERRLSSFPVPASVQHQWVLDQQINAYGARIDTPLVDSALALARETSESLTGEAVQLSGLDNPNSVSQLTQWLQKNTEEEITDLRKSSVTALLDHVEEGAAKRMLQIRQELSKTSVKKYAAMRDSVGPDGRIRGLMQFYGANRTGRDAGRLVQVQNLPRNYLSTLDLARKLVREKKLDSLRHIYGSVPDTLSQLIRTAFIPSDGHVLIVADFSAIEARVVAWLAGEDWVLDVFREHGKIYEATASQMFGVPVETIVKGRPEYALRQKGKIATLALGYQGGPNALIKMGALDQGLSEEELPEIVQRWRDANPHIVNLWYSVERAAMETMRTGQPVSMGDVTFARESDIAQNQDFFTITLPSGRQLFYAQPFLTTNAYQREALHYHGMNQTTKKWEVISTYGGRIVENITQAVARDCLYHSLERLSEAGYQAIFHVHDEVILDAPENSANVENVLQIMGEAIPWAPGLPLKADGFTTPYYRKD